jgi:hypothetical protein
MKLDIVNNAHSLITQRPFGDKKGREATVIMNMGTDHKAVNSISPAISAAFPFASKGTTTVSKSLRFGNFRTLSLKGLSHWWKI